MIHAVRGARIWRRCCNSLRVAAQSPTGTSVRSKNSLLRAALCAGVNGFGDDEPEPSVLGGVGVRLAVVGCEKSLLAMLLFYSLQG